MKTKSLTISLILFFLATNFISGQDNKSTKDKLDKIKGDVSKIVITSNSGDVVFEGEEAQQLFKKIKSKKLHWISEGDDDIDIDGENVMIFKSEDGEKHIIKHKGHGNKMMMFMNDDDKDHKIITVDLEDENGEKTLTVTTTENGEEKIETFKGKEADEQIEKMNKEGDVQIEIITDDDVDSKQKHVWVGDMLSDVEKKVEVKIDNDEKVVTVTTKEDGKEKVNVYKGKEADEYLEKMEKEDKMIIKEKIIDGKKHKKIIIKEIEKEENE
ncbi:MAG: hypothetical protein H6613_15865 [Ignavibacteriales bacterium]|nr:hypothetical protein [Ignavibacteriales bacterium]